MIDWLFHQAEIVSLIGNSYRLKDRDLGRVPSDDNPSQPAGEVSFHAVQRPNFRALLTRTCGLAGTA
jgi:hypothetical protein